MAEAENPQEAQHFYTPVESEAPQTPTVPSEPLSWTASEFIAHEKSVSWYVALSGAALLIAVLIYVFTRDKISAIVVLVGAFFLGVYAGRQPRQLGYQVDDRGVQIDQKFFAYEEFRSFAIADEGAFSSIVFMPLKRFAPTTTIYFAPDDEEKIVAILSSRLPLEPHRSDVVDNLMKRIRF